MAERNGTQPPRTGSNPSGQNRPPYLPNNQQVGTLLPEPFPPPFPELPPPDSARLQKEYVAGGGWAWYGQVARTLSNSIDDVTADFGEDLYSRMLYDPQISAVHTIWKASILESGLNLTSAVRSRKDPDYDLAAEIADEAAHMIQEFDGTLDDVLWDMLNCVSFGNRVAEQTYRLQAARKDGRKILVLDKLKVRPMRSTVYAVDIYFNLVGLLIRVPPNASPWSATMMFGPDDEPFNLIAPHKFVIMNNKPKDNDPRGTSILRPAYSAWWRKQQIIPEYLRYLSQFAGPSLIGYVGPEATPQPDGQGGVITAEQVMLGALQALRNGTAAAFPNGASVDPLVMQGDGAAFLRAIDHCDQQITKAVLTQELATEEGKHMARAAAEVHQDVLDTLIRQGKLAYGTQIRNQLFKRWVGYNWGNDAVHLAPLVGLGKTVLRDSPAMWGAAAQLMGQGYLAPSQLQALDEQIGLPVRDELELYPVEEDPNDPASSEDTGTPVGQPAADAPPSSQPGRAPTSAVGAPLKPELPDKAPWQKSIPPPSSTKHKPTVAKPSLPGKVGVRAHSRTKRKPSDGPYSVTEASSGSANGALPTPSAGAFAATREPRPELATYPGISPATYPHIPLDITIHHTYDEPKPMRIESDPIVIESHVEQQPTFTAPPIQGPVTIRRELQRDAEGRISGVIEVREPVNDESVKDESAKEHQA